MAIKPVFIENEIYHIYNRGVEKREIFLNKGDYLRFVYNLFARNGQKGINHSGRLSNAEIVNFLQYQQLNPSNQLVEILGFVLMPNHFHLIVRQKVDGGVVKFMQKLCTAHTMFFNKKYNRVGPLFQGNFKAVNIDNDTYFLYILHYIHLNPLGLAGNLNNSGQGRTLTKLEFLERYTWSSLPGYLGLENDFLNIFNKEFFLDIFKGKENYKKDLMRFIEDDTEEEPDSDLLLD